ncbi:alpha-galactosidase D [Micromonospora inositola]|uniref:Alpha-galactosidase n=1 Tax=Micromonospora inositola TaxID=47865 RepID=A0A1C5K3S3_9ACTN|nr:CBM35 domain-containing protein [Micromonospora inositola]SCG76966.1 Carbohydrate binding module (family 35) [Micromonospora inositola]
MKSPLRATAQRVEPPARRQSRVRTGVALAATLAVALGAGAIPAQAAAPGPKTQTAVPGPKPSPAPGSATPGATTKDPSAADRAAAQKAAAAAAAQGIADRPYMGWSSWSLQASNYPGLNPNGGASWLNEANLLPQVDALATRLKPYGYEYVNIDAGWSNTYNWTSNFDQYGREIAAPERFPHGMQYVADYIHAKGLKAGIYLAVGLAKPAYNNGTTPIWNAPACTTADIVYPDLRTTNGWDSSYKIDFSKPCAQKYIDSQAQLIADWGYDFLKFDGVGPGSFRGGDNYNNVADVAAWQAAIAKTGRPMEFLLSWSLDRNYAADWKRYSNGWRIDTDVECYCDTLVTWNNSVKIRWDDVPGWTPWAGPGGWNNLDSLNVGNGEMDGITEDERQSYMTLWAISAAPLYAGDDLTKLDAYGLSLLTNREVIAVDQQGIPARPVTPTGSAQVWGMKNGDGTYTIALFNMGSFPAQVSANWSSFGFGGKATVRDLWQHKELGVYDGSIAATLPSHGSRLFKVTPKDGAVKMTSYEAEASTNSLARGASVAGCANCSGAAKVGSLYNGGALRINGVTVPKTGTYQVNIRYTTNDPRSATVSANGQNAVTLAFPPSGGWDIPATLTVALQLHAGANTIEIDSTTPVYSPDVDKIEVPLTVR